MSGDTPTRPPGLSVYTVTVNFTLQQGLNRLTLQQPSQSRVSSKGAESSPARGASLGLPRWDRPLRGTTQQSAGHGEVLKENRGRKRLRGSDDNMGEGLLEAEALLQLPPTLKLTG